MPRESKEYELNERMDQSLDLTFQDSLSSIQDGGGFILYILAGIGGIATFTSLVILLTILLVRKKTGIVTESSCNQLVIVILI